jgi:hypothetical protein
VNNSSQNFLYIYDYALHVSTINVRDQVAYTIQPNVSRL